MPRRCSAARSTIRVRARKFLGVIDRHSERLSRLIDDLLTLSDLELGKSPLKKDAVLLESLVDEVFEVLGEKAERGQGDAREGAPARACRCSSATATACSRC